MPAIISTTNPGDVIDVTGNSGTLNGSPQGGPITDIAIRGPSAEVTISNSSIGHLTQSSGTGMEVTATNSTITSISGGNGGATYTFDNVTVTHGTNLGGGDNTLEWSGGTISGGIVAGNGDDTLTFDGTTFNSAGFNFGNGSNDVSFHDATFQPGTAIVVGTGPNTVEISGDTSIGQGSVIQAQHGSSDELVVPDGSVIEIGGTQYTVGTDPVPSGYGTHGTVTLPNGSGFMFQNFDTFSSSGPVCFATGTLISTPDGVVAVENLKVGNQISTREGEARELLWIGKFDVHFNAHNAHHRPIEFKRGSLGGNVPATTLTVSPQHRILIRNPTGQEVLAPAKAFTNLPKIRVCKGMRKVTYHALLLDVHSVILANGAEVESFFPGEQGMDFVGPMLRRQTGKALQNGAKYRDQGARPFVSVQSARQYLSSSRRSAWSSAVAHRTAARDALPKAG